MGGAVPTILPDQTVSLPIRNTSLPMEAASGPVSTVGDWHTSKDIALLGKKDAMPHQALMRTGPYLAAPARRRVARPPQSRGRQAIPTTHGEHWSGQRRSRLGSRNERAAGAYLSF
jgi:hypothetical protein